MVVPNGPLSQYVLLFGSRKLSGSPSVRCGSTTVAGLKTSLPPTYVGVGVPPGAPPPEPGGVTLATGALLVAKVPL